MHYQDRSLTQLLFLYLWPFWMFKDASRGSLYERAAAYRHNRDKRMYLPGYAMKWTILCAVFLAQVEGFARAARESQSLCLMFGCFSAGAGMLFTVGFCILMVTGYTYVCLARAES